MEILCEIFKDDRNVLLNLAQTSKSMSELVWPRLYRSVRLADPWMLDGFLKLMLSRPERLKFVQDFSMSIMAPQKMRTVMTLMLLAQNSNNLRSIYLFAGDGVPTDRLVTTVIAHTIARSPRLISVRFRMLENMPVELFTLSSVIHVDLEETCFEQHTLALAHVAASPWSKIETITIRPIGSVDSLFSIVERCGIFQALKFVLVHWQQSFEDYTRFASFFDSAGNLEQLTIDYEDDDGK